MQNINKDHALSGSNYEVSIHTAAVCRAIAFFIFVMADDIRTYISADNRQPIRNYVSADNTV